MLEHLESQLRIVPDPSKLESVWNIALNSIETATVHCEYQSQGVHIVLGGGSGAMLPHSCKWLRQAPRFPSLRVTNSTHPRPLNIMPNPATASHLSPCFFARFTCFFGVAPSFHSLGFLNWFVLQNLLDVLMPRLWWHVAWTDAVASFPPSTTSLDLTTAPLMFVLLVPLLFSSSNSPTSSSIFLTCLNHFPHSPWCSFFQFRLKVPISMDCRSSLTLSLRA